MRDLVPDGVRALEKYEVPIPPGVRVKLDANESPFELPADVAAGLRDHLATVPLHRYPDAGAARLREALARGLGCAPGALCVGNGSDELVSLLVAGFSRPRAPGGRARICYPVPTFAFYRMAAAAFGVETLEVPLGEGFQLEEDGLERALAAGRPNVVFLAWPNNPTGTLWPRELIVRVLERHPDTLVVSDEAYHDYSGETLIDLLPRHENLVVMRTLSKIGLAALRVGCLIAAPPVLEVLEKVRAPYNVGALNQVAAAWVLERHGARLREQAGQVVAERVRVAAALAALPGVTVFPSHANLLLFRVGEPGDGRGAATWRQLVDRGVLVRDLDRPGPLAGCLRVTIGTPEENEAFLAAMRR